MDEISNPTTFASFITPPGILIAGALIMTLIQLLKAVFPALSNYVNGLQQAFIFSAALYVLTAIVLMPLSADGFLWVFTAWLTCAGTAVAAYEAAVRVQLLQTPTQNSSPPPTRTVIGRNERFDEP